MHGISRVSRYSSQEPDLHFEREDSPDDDILELSSDSEEDRALLATSRLLASDVRLTTLSLFPCN